MTSKKNNFNLADTLETLDSCSNEQLRFYSLKKFENEFQADLSKLPISIKLLLENAIRNFDGNKITEEHIYHIASWQPNNNRIRSEVPFIPARILLQDYTGIPLLADLASMRSIIKKTGLDPKLINRKRSTIPGIV